MWKKILAGIVLILIAIQFFPARLNSSAQPPGKDDIIVRYGAPANVQAVLHTACYDCHSNSTRYPWYNKIQPVGWWLANHINDGKHSLNFSEFGSYPQKRQSRKINAVSDQVTDHDMPLWSYKLIHGDARLTDTQIKAVADWADKLHDQIDGNGGK